MRFFANPEIKRLLVCWAVLLALSVGVTGWLLPDACLFVGTVGLLTGGLFLLFTARRYRRLRAYSAELSDLRNGKDTVSLQEYSEGELSVLNTELQKVVLQMRDRAQALQRDQQRLQSSVADISHQLRTPLTSMMLMAEFLHAENLPEPRRLQLSKDLQQLIGRTETLVELLLKLARLDAGAVVFQKQRVRVEDLLRQASEPLAVPIELREQTLVCRTHGETFVGDLKWSAEAVGNVLKNCMEHTPHGGEITVDCAENAMYTELVVTDTGAGIAPEDLPHLFERFYKGKNASETSVGIGLALAQLILRAQNGTIRAENVPQNGTAPPRGARFVLRFYKGAI